MSKIELTTYAMQLGQSVSARLVGVDAEDLPELSSIYDELGVLAESLVQEDSGAARDLTHKARETIEHIVMRSVEDADEALRGVCRLVDDLQQLLNGAPAKQVPVVETAVRAPATPQIQGDEAPIKEEDLPLLGEFVTEARGHLESAEVQLLSLEENPGDQEAVNSVFRSFHTIKGVAGFLNLRQIGALAHAAETVLDLVRQGKLSFSRIVADAVLQATDVLKVLINAAESAGASRTAIPAEPRLAPMVQLLEKLANGGDVPIPMDTKVASVSSASKEQSATPGGHQPAHGQGGSATVKIATERLDNLINMVGELVIAQAMVAQGMSAEHVGEPKLTRNVAHVGKIVRELQDLSMSMRMVPIQGLFQKMGRLVRDLCRKLDKEIDLVLTGGETELDRNVVEVLGDPLMHMVRNAGDHGIEQPDERRKKGKPPTGKLELRARHEAGFIVIEIVDDGKGLNRERIIRKAIAAGIVSEGQELSDQEAHRLIFHAGLSTAEKVTDVSGRGVGMDVVKKNIEALRGQVDIASTEGVGSVFTIRLPLTMAVIDGLVARVGHHRYIIPTTSIEQSIRPTPAQLSTVQGRGEVCVVRGRTLPMFRLHRLFGIADAATEPSEALVVIVQDNDRRCCLMVDELLGQQQVVIKSLGEGIGAVPGISGGAILGDGNVSLILDIHALIELASMGDPASANPSLSQKEIV